MNDRDIQLASALSTELRAGDTSLLYLVSTKYTNIVRVNLVILKALLDGLKLKGIVITVDRPHQYRPTFFNSTEWARTTYRS